MPRLSTYDRISYWYLLAAKVATVLLAFATTMSLLRGDSIPLTMVGCTLGIYYLAYDSGRSR